MTKIDTINKYKAEFLKGKSEAFIEKFNNKSIEKKYISVMAWKTNQKKRAAKKGGVKEINELLKQVKGIIKIAALTPDELKEIAVRISQISELISNYEDVQRQNIIKTLELEQEKLDQQKQMIEDRIKALKGE